MSPRPIFRHTRPAAAPSLEGVYVTVSASITERDEDGAGPFVTIARERDDFPEKDMHPTQIVLTVEEFQGIATGIVNALDGTPAPTSTG